MTAPYLTIGGIHDAYRNGRTPRDVIDGVLDHLSGVDDPGIFIHTASREALAEQADVLGAFDPQDKPLWGIPFAVKDNIDVAGMPTTAACPAYSYVPDEDAAVVRQLRDAGGIAVGKTNLDQFATGLVGTRTPYPIPRNALDPSLVPGGSSSGSAVAVAQGIVPFALGTDTAGSGRIPAGLNGIVGLKPSLGALSTRGVVPACRTLDCVSIFAANLADAARVFDTACAYDSRDPYSRPWRDAAETRSDGDYRIGVPRIEDRRFFGDDAAQQAYESALAELAQRGAEIVPIPFQPFYDIAGLLYEGPWVAERYAAIADFIATNEEDLHPVTRAIITRARNFTAVDTFNGIYALETLKRRTTPLLSGIDLLCVPTAPTWYTVAENLADPVETNSRLGTYTNFVNLLGLCGLVLPTGRQGDGRPASITFLAPDGMDRFLQRFAGKFATSDAPAANGGAQLSAPATDTGAVEIAVFGAHLTGLPLNHELTDLGGSFRRTARTLDDYRLFALPGTAPQKPGLLRVTQGTGHAIEAEIWSLSTEAFGAFVSRIPAPLCLGQVRFEDGSTVQGFLVESEGVRDARDVSDFGGWRQFVASRDAATLTETVR